jgi:hypothetical protein
VSVDEPIDLVPRFGVRAEWVAERPLSAAVAAAAARRAADPDDVYSFDQVWVSDDKGGYRPVGRR